VSDIAHSAAPPNVLCFAKKYEVHDDCVVSTITWHARSHRFAFTRAHVSNAHLTIRRSLLKMVCVDTHIMTSKFTHGRAIFGLIKRVTREIHTAPHTRTSYHHTRAHHIITHCSKKYSCRRARRRQIVPHAHFIFIPHTLICSNARVIEQCDRRKENTVADVA